MARFFFSIRAGERLIPDREGIELPAHVDLDACATYLAGKLRGELGLPETDLDGLAVEVTDMGGALLKTVVVTSR